MLHLTYTFTPSSVVAKVGRQSKHFEQVFSKQSVAQTRSLFPSYTDTVQCPSFGCPMFVFREVSFSPESNLKSAEELCTKQAPSNMRVAFDTAVVVPGKKLLPKNQPPPVLLSRLSLAVDVFTEVREKGGQPVFIVSGGIVASLKDIDDDRAGGDQDVHDDTERLTEAEVMKCELMKKKIPAEFIFKEEEALHTIENVLFIRKIVFTHNLRHVVVVNSRFHMKRTKLIFDAFFEDLLRPESNTRILSLSYKEVDDCHLMNSTQTEKEKLTETAMIERFQAHYEIYAAYLVEKITLTEARKQFYQGDKPHHSVYKQSYSTSEEQA